jgi:hypothetical protein
MMSLKKLLEKNIHSVKVGMSVIYIPKHQLNSIFYEDSQLGVITYINYGDKYAFVKYIGDIGSTATSLEDLYSLEDRKKLIEKINSHFNVKRIKYSL